MVKTTSTVQPLAVRNSSWVDTSSATCCHCVVLVSVNVQPSGVSVMVAT
jgi:hypothetical protein